MKGEKPVGVAAWRGLGGARGGLREAIEALASERSVGFGALSDSAALQLVYRSIFRRFTL